MSLGEQSEPHTGVFNQDFASYTYVGLSKGNPYKNTYVKNKWAKSKWAKSKVTRTRMPVNKEEIFLRIS